MNTQEQIDIFERQEQWLRNESRAAFLAWQDAPPWKMKKAFRRVQEISRRSNQLRREFSRFLETIS